MVLLLKAKEKGEMVTNNDTNDYFELDSARSDEVVSIMVTILAALATVINVLTIILTGVVEDMRKTISSVFYTYLCLVDIVASITVMSCAIVSLSGHSLDSFSHVRQILGRFQESTMTASVLTIAVMTLEKYVYIKYPMRHETSVTLQRSLALLLLISSIATLSSFLPQCGFRRYIFRNSVFVSVKWVNPRLDKLMAACKGALLFTLPLSEIVVVSLKLYRVAKRAMLAIEPAPHSFGQGNTSSTTMRKYSVMFVVDISNPEGKSKNEGGCRTEARPLEISAAIIKQRVDDDGTQADSTAKCRRNSVPYNNSGFIRSPVSPGTQLSNDAKKRNWKALILLTLPVCYFTVVWLPITIVQIIKAWDNVGDTNNDAEYSIFELTSFFLILASYAINPIVYGYLSKSFREKVTESCKTWCCVDKNIVRPLSSTDESDEDFLQFLHRTSGSAQGDREKERESGSTGDILLNTFPERSFQLNIPGVT